MKIKKNDMVIIIAGKDNGKKGKVIESYPDRGKIIVAGVSIRKKHTKAKRSGEKGQIVEKPGPIDVSNAMLICPKCGKPARIGYKLIEKHKYRICKKCSQEI